MDIALKMKLAQVEADLVAAHAMHGMKGFHAETLRKFAGLEMDADDMDAVVDAMIKEAESSKTAAIGPLQAMMLAPVVAGPVLAAGRMIMDKFTKERNWKSVQNKLQGEISRDPERARQVYDLLWKLSPTLASSEVAAVDLMRQLLALPMLDLGTMSRLVETQTKRYSGQHHSPPGLVGSMTGMTEGLSNAGGAARALQDLGMMPSPHTKISTVLDWNTAALKKAGLTDAFTGSGTIPEQADQGFQYQQMSQGDPFVNLDTVVQELLQKEQEMAQREDVMAQQEQQLREALQVVQQMQGQYQGATGVDPQTQEFEPEDEEYYDGYGPEGMEQGMPPEGMEQGMPPEGMPPEGMEQGMPPEGMEQGMPPEGMPPEVMEQGMPPEGVEQGMPPEGMPPEGMEQGMPPEGVEQDDHDMGLIQQGVAMGPHTPESVEGSTEDEMHDAVNRVEEGSPEDEIADAELAAVLNAREAQGQEEEEEDKENEITLPLRISVKIGETNPILEKRAELLRDVDKTIATLFRS